MFLQHKRFSGLLSWLATLVETPVEIISGLAQSWFLVIILSIIFPMLHDAICTSSFP